MVGAISHVARNWIGTMMALSERYRAKAALFEAAHGVLPKAAGDVNYQGVAHMARRYADVLDLASHEVGTEATRRGFAMHGRKVLLGGTLARGERELAVAEVMVARRRLAEKGDHAAVALADRILTRRVP